jgi:hypothetical protein
MLYDLLLQFLRWLSYRPERHYMRGRAQGPATDRRDAFVGHSS